MRCVTDASKLNDVIFAMKEKHYLVDSIALAPSKMNLPNSIAATLTIKTKKKVNVQNILADVNKIDGVNFALVNYSIVV